MKYVDIFENTLNRPFLMKHPWVILFDIDGTLLTVDRNFNRPLLRSIVDDLGITYHGVETDPFSGRTDHDILSSFLENHGSDANLYNQLKSTYIDRLTSELRPEHILLHSFVHEAISYFSNERFIPGLLTGNFPDAAKVKLSRAGIVLDSKIGAFGEFHRDRNMLPQIAISSVEQLLNIEAEPDKFVIIGDTPRDIECAKSAGMRSVAVTTGKFSGEELSSFEPDMILESLQNPEMWFEKLVGQPV